LDGAVRRIRRHARSIPPRAPGARNLS
jgi:hypothetical protein